MAQLNKDERVWVCFEMAKVQNDCECGLTVGLSEEFLPFMRYSRTTGNTSSMALA